MTEYEAYQEHIRYTHDTYCRIVIRHASFDAARMLTAKRGLRRSWKMLSIMLLRASVSAVSSFVRSATRASSSRASCSVRSKRRANLRQTNTMQPMAKGRS